jgi:hypothetical protein
MEVNTRSMCDILEDMRKCYDTRNFSYLPALIEEAQYRANRMEYAIDAYRDMGYNEEKRLKLKKEVKELMKKKRDIK